jgi:hypothetical protein
LPSLWYSKKAVKATHLTLLISTRASRFWEICIINFSELQITRKFDYILTRDPNEFWWGAASIKLNFDRSLAANS